MLALCAAGGGKTWCPLHARTRRVLLRLQRGGRRASHESVSGGGDSRGSTLTGASGDLKAMFGRFETTIPAPRVFRTTISRTLATYTHYTPDTVTSFPPRHAGWSVTPHPEGPRYLLVASGGYTYAFPRRTGWCTHRFRLALSSRANVTDHTYTQPPHPPNNRTPPTPTSS